MATLKDIAQAAGVSTMTVSNVLNGNYSKVSEKTAKRILEIVKAKKYNPNMSARNLRVNQSHIFAVLLAKGKESHDLISNPYYWFMTGLIEQELHNNGYFLMLRTYETKDDIIKLFQHWNIDGAIMFYPFFGEEDMRAVEETGMPVVLLDRFFEDLSTITVDLDDYSGGKLAADYLMDRGHTKLGFVSPTPTIDSDSQVMYLRMQGFAKAMEERGLAFQDNYYFYCPNSFEAAVELGKHISCMEDPPTAVAASSNKAATGIIEGVKLSGRSVPGDLSVVGFDDWEDLKYITPRLTTVAQDFAERARQAVKLLLSAVEEKNIPQRHITLNVTLIERDSVSTLAK